MSSQNSRFPFSAQTMNLVPKPAHHVLIPGFRISSVNHGSDRYLFKFGALDLGVRIAILSGWKSKPELVLPAGGSLRGLGKSVWS
jgi:hypothetical protein